jgi:hypothetical protein
MTCVTPCIRTSVTLLRSVFVLRWEGSQGARRATGERSQRRAASLALACILGDDRFPACFRVASPHLARAPREVPPLGLHLNYLNYCAIISRALISSRQRGYMVHAARASVNRATARFILRPVRRRSDGGAASKGSSAAYPSTRHFLIAGEEILKTELTPSMPIPNVFLIAGAFAHFRVPGSVMHNSNRYTKLLEIALTPSAPAQNTFLIATICPTFTPAPLFTHHSSLIPRHRLTPFLIDTNETDKIFALLKTKKKRLSIRYKFALRGTGNLACARWFGIGPLPSAPHITHRHSLLTIRTSALDSFRPALLIVGRTSIQERP